MKLDDAAASDSATDWASLRSAFARGQAGTYYLDANSIGPMPKQASQRLAQVLQLGWVQARRRAWSSHDWLAAPQELGAGIAHLLGCGSGDVVVTGATSVNWYQLLRYGLACAAPRRVLVIERHVFPTNRYVVEGLVRAGLAEVRFIDDPERLPNAVAAGDVAVVALSLVDYRSSRRWDMAPTNRLIRDAGALSLWDLSHAVGAVAIDLLGTGADLAVACGYKYLCGGPGAPALLYVHPRWADVAWPAICGWMGHDQTFAFEPSFRPAVGPKRFLAATPQVLANASFSAAVELWRRVDVTALNERHRSLTDTLITLIEQRCAGLGWTLQSPREHERRGGHLAWQFESAAALAQCLGAHRVVVSARAPDSVRWAVHPLTTRHRDLWHAVTILRRVLRQRLWDEPQYRGPSI